MLFCLSFVCGRVLFFEKNAPPPRTPSVRNLRTKSPIIYWKRRHILYLINGFKVEIIFCVMRQPIFSSVTTRKVHGKPGKIAGPLVFLLLAAGVLGIFYLASLSKGSNEVYETATEVAVDPAMAEKMLHESRSLESQFNSIHEFKKDKVSSADVDLYEKAVENYRLYLTYAGAAASYNPRYEQMRKHLHNLRADGLRKLSSELETQAEACANEKKYDEAEKYFNDAATLEVRITKEFPLATKKNHARANFLENRAKTMRAIPMQIKAQELEAQGEAALNEANWPKANLCLTEALSIEKVLWADYRNVIVSNSSRIHRIQDLLSTIGSAPDYERREKYTAEAKAQEQAENWEAAAKLWAQALASQKTIIQNFPRSLYADKETEETLTKNYADASARPQFILLQKDYAELTSDIRERKLEHVSLIAKQALRRAENILREWPESTLVSEAFIQELRYMDLKAPDIAGVQSNFFNLLLPIPGHPNKAQMLKTEVSQALYSFVMPFNPSARKDLAYPVESVDFNDAQEFCRRLSLLIGCKVRLPSQEEFTMVAGTPNAENVLEQAWLIENSSGVIHTAGSRKANAGGFFDLYGNVAEWVIPSPEEGLKNFESFVAGGDCQTPTYAFPEEVFKKVPRSEKSRTRGFRVVVEN